MDDKNKKTLAYILVGIFVVSSLFSIIYIFLYYNVFNSEPIGKMKTAHALLLVSTLIGFLASLYFFDKLETGTKQKYNSMLEERRRSAADYLLQNCCHVAEKLHSNLSNTLGKHGIVRVWSGFQTYDLLYFIKPDKWFGFTFHEDYREGHIEIKLGELYHFRSFPMSFIIVGEYTKIIKKLNEKNLIASKIPPLRRGCKNVAKTVEIIENTFDAVIENIDVVFDDGKKMERSPYLIKKIKSIDDLKQLDADAITE